MILAIHIFFTFIILTLVSHTCQVNCKVEICKPDTASGPGNRHVLMRKVFAYSSEMLYILDGKISTI